MLNDRLSEPEPCSDHMVLVMFPVEIHCFALCLNYSSLASFLVSFPSLALRKYQVFWVDRHRLGLNTLSLLPFLVSSPHFLSFGTSNRWKDWMAFHHIAFLPTVSLLSISLIMKEKDTRKGHKERELVTTIETQPLLKGHCCCFFQFFFYCLGDITSISEDKLWVMERNFHTAVAMETQF